VLAAGRAGRAGARKPAPFLYNASF